MWALLNRGNAKQILADTTLTQRIKQAILAQKDLTNRAALERIIRSKVGNDEFEEYYSDVGPESDSSDSDSEGNQEDSTEDESVVQRTDRNVITTLIRETRIPRRLRFRDITLES